MRKLISRSLFKRTSSFTQIQTTKFFFSSTPLRFDKQTAELLYKIGTKSVEEGNLENAVEYFRRALFERHDDISLHVASLRELALVLCKMGELDGAQMYLEQAKTYPIIDKIQKYSLIAVEAIVKLKRGDVDIAMEIMNQKLPKYFDDPRESLNWSMIYYDFAVELLEHSKKEHSKHSKDKASICSFMYLNIAKRLAEKCQDDAKSKPSLYLITKKLAEIHYFNCPKAIEYYNEALNIAEELFGEDSIEFVTILTFLCEFELKVHGFEKKAIIHAERARKLCQEMLKRKPNVKTLGALLRVLAVQIQYFAMKKDYQLALSLLEPAISLAKTNKQFVRHIELLHIASTISMEMNDFKSPIKYLEETKEMISKLPKEHQVSQFISRFRLLGDLYEKSEQYEKLISNQEEAIQFIFNQMNNHVEIYQPELEYAYQRYMYGYAMLGNIEESEKIMDQASNTFNPNKYMKSYLALVYIKNKEYEKAITILQGLLVDAKIDETPKFQIDCLEKLKDCYFNLQKKQEFLNTIDDIIKLTNDEEKVKQLQNEKNKLSD